MIITSCVVCRNVHRFVPGGSYQATLGQCAVLCVNMFMSICVVGYDGYRMCCV